MDIFEKQQTIEAIKTVIKARWFYVLAILMQGLVIRLLIKDVPLANNSILVLITLGNLVFNFWYWIYLRRPLEKIGQFTLKTIKAMQVIADQLGVFGVLYFSGTINKLLVVSLFITLMVGSYLYQKKGILLSVLLAASLYSGLAIMEYFGFLSAYFGPSPLIQPTLKGDINLTKAHIVGFNFYMLAAVFFAVYLSSLFKSREKKLIVERNESVQKTQLLTTQTQELTKTKDYLHEALTKSDAARIETEKIKEELQKANFELQAKIRELEKYGRVTTGRELKMIELKEKIKSLEERIRESENK